MGGLWRRRGGGWCRGGWRCGRGTGIRRRRRRRRGVPGCCRGAAAGRGGAGARWGGGRAGADGNVAAAAAAGTGCGGRSGSRGRKGGYHQNVVPWAGLQGISRKADDQVPLAIAGDRCRGVGCHLYIGNSARSGGGGRRRGGYGGGGGGGRSRCCRCRRGGGGGRWRSGSWNVRHRSNSSNVCETASPTRRKLKMFIVFDAPMQRMRRRIQVRERPFPNRRLFGIYFASGRSCSDAGKPKARPRNSTLCRPLEPSASGRPAITEGVRA